MPSVSAIIPSYNHASFLKQRIDSVLNQTFQDFEVIILDDCSTDHSQEIIELYRSHPKVKHFVFNDLNSGSTFVQWKKGIELSQAPFIWIAESDDFSDHRFLEKLVPILSANDRLGIAYCQSFCLDAQNTIIGNWKSHTDDLDAQMFATDFSMNGSEYIRRYLIHKNTIPNASAVIFRRQYYQKMGGVETDIKYCSDWLTWMKILLYCDVYFCKDSLNYFRYHENSVIAKALREADKNQYFEKHNRTMRRRFQNHLDASHIEKVRIIQKNHFYISEENHLEQLFLAEQRKYQV